MISVGYDALWRTIGPDPFTRVRESCASVCENAKDIAISHEHLRRFADTLDMQSLTDVRHTKEHHLIGEGPATVAYFLIVDCLNFGSGYFPYLRALDGYSGYYTLSVGLKRWFIDAGVPSVERLATITPDELSALFGQDTDNPNAYELMELYSGALRQLSHFIGEHLGGRMEALLDRANHSADGLVRLLTRMSRFRDISTLAGDQVVFFKRAQMMIQDLSLAAKEGDIAPISGLQTITAFADNLLPYVLRAEGVLTYSQDLADKLDRQHLFEPGERQEVELRASGVHGLELVRQELARRGTTVTACDLDVVVWNYGQELKRRIGDQRHLCRSIFY